MTRRHVVFPSGWARLVGTIDEAPGATGLLIVSGGNEVRAGAWNGQSLLAARVAAAGFPVFRFDRAGIGDSSGDKCNGTHFSFVTRVMIRAASVFRGARR